MIKANFKTYSTYVTDSLHQWDINQVLTVYGLNLEVVPEIHFSNKNMDRAIVKQATMTDHVVSVNIPNSLLQEPLTIFAHIGIYEGNTFKVVEVVEIPIIPRTRPNDYKIEDSDEEIYSFKKLENEISNKVTYKDLQIIDTRIDNLAKLKDGSTTGDAELIDARVDYEGDIYNSLRQANVGSAKKLSAGHVDAKAISPENVSFLNRHSKNLFSKLNAKKDTWFQSATGNYITIEDAFCSELISCSFGDIFSFTQNSGVPHEVHFFDADKNYLLGLSITIGSDDTYFKVPEAPKYFIIQTKTIIDSYMLNYGSELLPYEEYEDYSLDVDIKELKELEPLKDYFEKGTNLFDRNNVKENTWYNPTNGFINLNGYFVTDFIPIKSSDYTISTSKIPANTTTEIRFFDEDFNVVNPSIELGSLVGTDTNETFSTLTHDAKYFIFCSNMKILDLDISINEGTELLEYEDYKNNLKTKYLNINEIYKNIQPLLETGQYEIVIPNQIYLRNNGVNEQYNIYFDNIFLGKKPPVIDVVCNYGKQLVECWRYETNSSAYSKASGSFSLTIKGLDENLNLLVSKTITITIVETSSDTAINYLAIGDSITNNGKYVKYAENKVANLSTMGIVSGINEDYYREGRSGWSLSNYLNNIGKNAYSSEFNVDSPFLYPIGFDGSSYKGNCSQIKAVIENKGTYILPYLHKAFMTDGEYDYDDNGYYKKPSVGDYMFDPELAEPWVEWDGTSWTSFTSQPTEFEFNFSKYMERYSTMFGGISPTHVSICLGANDFQTNSPTESTIEAWYEGIITMIESIKSYDSNIKIILLVPPLGASQDAWGSRMNSGATSYNYFKNLKLLEKVLISKYDETNNIYVAPIAEMIDTEYAYDSILEKRNAYTDETVNRNNNWVHPNEIVGHNQMSDSLLGIFEKTR